MLKRTGIIITAIIMATSMLGVPAFAEESGSQPQQEQVSGADVTVTEGGITDQESETPQTEPAVPQAEQEETPEALQPDDETETGTEAAEETEETDADVLEEEMQAAEEDGGKQLMSTRTVTIVLDPGHGGSENGAYYGGIKEKVINLKIAKACKAELEKYQGVKVYLTRTGDTTLSLPQRAEKAGKYDPDMLISIHNNAVDKEGTGGAEAWYPNKYGPDSYSIEGQELGAHILNELHYEGLYNRGTKSKTGKKGMDYYGIIRNCKRVGFPAIIVEHAYMDITAERVKYLSSDSSLKKLGIADATAIADYYGLKRFSVDKNRRVRDLDGSIVKNRWVRIDGKYHHANSSGYQNGGFCTIGGGKYYIAYTGAKKGWLTKNDNKYYRFNDRGQFKVNTVCTIGNHKYGFDQNGKMLKGCTKVIKDWKYLFTASGLSVVYKAKTKTTINTRKSTSVTSKNMGKIAKGKSLTVVKVSGDWSQLADGRWFKTKYRTSVSSYPQFVPYRVKTTANLNYRKGPGTSYAKKGMFPKGKVFTVHARKSGWGKTSGGYWVSLQYTERVK